MIRGFHTIHNRLFLLFLFGMLGLLMIISALFYRFSTDQIQSKIGEISRKSISQTVGLFDLLLNGYDGLSKSISGNVDLQRLLRETKDQNPAVSVINERTITNMLGTIYFSRDDLLGIHIITNSDRIYSYQNYLNVIDLNYKSAPWVDQLRNSGGEMVWLGVNKSSLIDKSVNRSVFSFGRQIYDVYNNRPVGVVLFEVFSEPILSALSNLSLGPGSQSYVIDEDGRIMASNTPSTEVPSALRKYIRNSGGRQPLLEQGPEELIVAAKPSNAPWTVLSVTPNKDLNVELNETKQYFILVVSVLVVLSVLLATFVSRTISNPLKRLIRQMRQVENGNFRGMVNVRSYEEINSVVTSFNHMVHRMDELIERVKVSSMSEKSAQLQALQSQVNPHFLYNTLDMIYWMLDEKENDRLGRVVLSLSRMFQYSSRWEEGADVTLREELEQIQHYLSIIGYRLEGRIQTRIEVDARWNEMILPKMTLQPIIENAVKYGLEPVGRPGEIRVFAVIDGHRLNIVITDNGCGMEAEVLRRLRESLGETLVDEVAVRRGRKGIGLTNLHRRLVLMFGEGYGLQVESVRGEGTTVTVSMPLPPLGGGETE
ncbi:histidine kinase [Paenibacillus swuensis]|uniref:histidine kinase n=1 Tax=Paenibacillus swuensis TaxID=1178515 RepID=A0A172TF27_9BACL|nr:sensor histidine kinase [Paenibacillus swuensis]ANE45487.1 histidine kinase [Paenibacillus swuensis]